MTLFFAEHQEDDLEHIRQSQSGETGKES
jgi:hypothetical protein